MNYEFKTSSYFDSLDELLKSQGCEHVRHLISKADYIDLDNFPLFFKFVAVSQPDNSIVRLWVATNDDQSGDTYIEIFLPVAKELLQIMTNDLIRIYLSDRKANARLEKYLGRKLTAAINI